MTETSPVIAPDVAAAAIEVLRLAADPAATTARLNELAAKSAEAHSTIAAAAAAFDQLLQAQVEHESTLKGMAAQQQAEHAARLKYLISRESELDTRERQLAADRVKVDARERDAEARAAYLGARLRGENVRPPAA